MDFGSFSISPAIGQHSMAMSNPGILSQQKYGKSIYKSNFNIIDEYCFASNINYTKHLGRNVNIPLIVLYKETCYISIGSLLDDVRCELFYNTKNKTLEYLQLNEYNSRCKYPYARNTLFTIGTYCADGHKSASIDYSIKSIVNGLKKDRIFKIYKLDNNNVPVIDSSDTKGSGLILLESKTMNVLGDCKYPFCAMEDRMCPCLCKKLNALFAIKLNEYKKTQKQKPSAKYIDHDNNDSIDGPHKKHGNSLCGAFRGIFSRSSRSHKKYKKL